MSDSGSHTVIIGSGLGGLSAAAYLAASGQQVTLLERYSVLGGSSHVYRRRGQWEFDCGVHYMGNCGRDGAIPALLRGLGLEGRIEFEAMDSAGFDTIIGPDFELRVPFGWDGYEANLIAAFPGEAGAIRRYVKVLHRLSDAIDQVWSPYSIDGHRRVLWKAGPAAVWAMVPLATFMLACGLSPRAMMVLSVQCGALATNSMTLPTAAMAVYLQHFVAGGSYYPRGGGQMFAAEFSDVVRVHGGVIRTNSEVARILVEGGRAAGVQLVDGEVIRADAVVSDADIIRTYRELVGFENLPLHTRLMVDRFVMGLPLINGFFGVEIDIAATPNSNYFTIPTWDDSSSAFSLLRMSRDLMGRNQRGRDGVDWARQFAARQPMFVQCSTRRDLGNKRSAPAGHAAIEVQTIVPPSPALWGFEGSDPRTGDYRKGAKYRAVKELVTEGMLQRLEQTYPGASSNVKITELGTPATQTRFVGTTAGSAFGLDVRATQIAGLRPGPSTPIKGLYLAGTSTPWGPGTEGAMISGVFAASAVTGRNLADEVFNKRAVLVDPRRLSVRPADFDPLSTTRGLTGTQSHAFDIEEAIS